MKRRLFLSAVLAAVLVACPQPNPTPVIGTNGGTVTSSNGVASVVFPTGALTQDTVVTITETTNPPAAPSNQKFILGKTFTVGGGTGNFANPAALKIKLQPSEIAALGLGHLRPQAIISDVVVLQLNGSTWITISYTFDTATNILTVIIPGFGTYSLVVPNVAPPDTLPSIALTCTPTSIAVGTSSNCSAIAKDSSGTNLATQPTFTFTSSDTGKATVSSAGVVTGAATGTSNITASAGGITSNSVSMTVTSSNGGTANYDVVKIPAPQGAVQVVPFGFNNAGQVMIATRSNVGSLNADVHVGAPASLTKIIFPNGLSADFGNLLRGRSSILAFSEIINSSGQVMFYATKDGKNQPVYYNGSTVTEVDFGLVDPNSASLVGLNDNGTILGTSLGTKNSAFIWNNGVSTTVMASGSSFNYARGVNASGSVLWSEGISKNGAYTPFAANQKGNAMVFNDNELIAAKETAFINGKLSFDWKYWTGAQAATSIPKPLANTNGFEVMDVNNNGEILFYTDDPANPQGRLYYVYNTTNGATKKIDVTGSGYENAFLLKINDNGDILAQSNNNFEAAILKPKP